METKKLDKTEDYKRSDEPVFWGLFGFGGMVAAFALPALIICMLIAGFTDGKQCFHFVELLPHWWGAAALFIIIFGISFHSMHRLCHSAHDFGIRVNRLHQVLFYGFATLLTLAAAIILFLAVL